MAVMPLAAATADSSRNLDRSDSSARSSMALLRAAAMRSGSTSTPMAGLVMARDGYCTCSARDSGLAGRVFSGLIMLLLYSMGTECSFLGLGQYATLQVQLSLREKTDTMAQVKVVMTGQEHLDAMDDNVASCKGDRHDFPKLRVGQLPAGVTARPSSRQGIYQLT